MINKRPLPLAISALMAGVLLSGCQSDGSSQAESAEAAAKDTVTADQVVEQYIAIAQSKYGDSLSTAQALKVAVDQFLEEPSEDNLTLAQEAWLVARVPYQQSEVYRFGNSVVDDWEGKVNAWPLDEGLIDYVNAASYGEESEENPFYTANIIANPSLRVGGQEIDASTIDAALLAEKLHEVDGVEANVTTGYHAIEFMLWGQDLYGTEPGAGERPATDFDIENCTGGNCDRRRDYLSAVTDLLIADLEDIVAAWQPGGAAYEDLKGKGPEGGIATIVTGMGSLSYGELAGERTKLGLMLNDPEEEHDCFADNTHNSHFYDAKGIRNIYEGSYMAVDGTAVSGASLSALVAQVSPELDAEMQAKLEATEMAAQAMVDQAEKGNTFDVLIGAGNTEGNQIVQDFVDALVDQTKTLETIVTTLELEGIELEGSDSLDNPSAV